MDNKKSLFQLFISFEGRNKKHAQKLPCAIRSVLYPDDTGCDYDCEECIKRSIKKIYSLSIDKVYTCDDCMHFIGGGSFGECCDIKYGLVFENTPTCPDFVRENL